MSRLRRSCRVLRHTIGTPVASDVLIHEEPDPQWFVDLGQTKDNAVITINTNDRVTSEVRVIDATLPFQAPVLVQPRETGVQYFVEHNQVRAVDTTHNKGASRGERVN